MLNHIKEAIGRTLYVQIWEKRIKITDVADGRGCDEAPLVAIGDNDKGQKIILAIGNNASSTTGRNVQVVNPFSHPRALLSDFTVAEKLLQHFFRLIQKKKILAPIISVVIHPMEKIEGGLTQVEMRAFRELALNAGARGVVVYEGAEIPLHGFDFEALKAKENEGIQNQAPVPTQWVQILIVGIGILLAIGMAYFGN